MAKPVAQIMFDPAEDNDAICHAGDVHQRELEEHRGGIELPHQALLFRIETGHVIDPPFSDQLLIAVGSDWGDRRPLPAPKIDEQDVPGTSRWKQSVSGGPAY